MWVALGLSFIGILLFLVVKFRPINNVDNCEETLVRKYSHIDMNGEISHYFEMDSGKKLLVQKKWFDTAQEKSRELYHFQIIGPHKLVNGAQGYHVYIIEKTQPTK
jgi:hypothetical protein